MTKTYEQEITKAHEILKTESMMSESSAGSEQQSTTSHNNTSGRIKRQQTKSAREMATRTRSQSQIHIISLGYLNDIRFPLM